VDFYSYYHKKSIPKHLIILCFLDVTEF
jgi:hypothetical protein